MKFQQSIKGLSVYVSRDSLRKIQHSKIQWIIHLFQCIFTWLQLHSARQRLYRIRRWCLCSHFRAYLKWKKELFHNTNNQTTPEVTFMRNIICGNWNCTRQALGMGCNERQRNPTRLACTCLTANRIIS